LKLQEKTQQRSLNESLLYSRAMTATMVQIQASLSIIFLRKKIDWNTAV